MIASRFKFLLLCFIGIIVFIDNPFTGPFNEYQPITEVLGPFFYANLNAQYRIPLPFSILEWLCVFLCLAGFRFYRKNYQLRAVPTDVFVVTIVWYTFLFLSALLGAILRGGSSTAVFWAIKGPSLAPFLFYAAFQILRTKQDYIDVAKVILAGVTFKCLQGLYYYYVVLGGSLGEREYITTHVGAYVMSVPILFCIASSIFSPPELSPSSRRALLLPLFIILPAFFLNERRIEMVGLLFSFSLLLILMLLVKPVKTILWAAVMAPFVFIYTVVFRNAGGILSAPVKMIDSLFDDANASNLYRKIENFNLIETIKDNPIFGQGMGVNMKQVVPLVDISNIYEFYLVNPHNSMLWIAMSMGFIGMFLFILFIAVPSYFGTRNFFRSQDAFHKLVVFVALTNIGRYLLFCYGDMMFFNTEGNVFFALSLAALIHVNDRETNAVDAKRF